MRWLAAIAGVLGLLGCGALPEDGGECPEQAPSSWALEVERVYRPAGAERVCLAVDTDLKGCSALPATFPASITRDSVRLWIVAEDASGVRLGSTYLPRADELVRDCAPRSAFVEGEELSLLVSTSPN